MDDLFDARRYWDGLAPDYQQATSISCQAFHLGPLLPSAEELDVLPHRLEELRCLELGCGAGQNSICLARRGARCVAVDISAAQLEHGRHLAQQYGLTVDFRQASLDELADVDWGLFDFVHSTYALPFVADPVAVLDAAARLLRPGGELLLTTAHPVFAGEWLEIEELGQGMFLPDYFRPPPDVRSLEDGDAMIQARSHPVSSLYGWLVDAGLTVRDILEPEPLPVPLLSGDELASRVPYYSEAWLQLYPQIAKVPVVVIFRASKPSL